MIQRFDTLLKRVGEQVELGGYAHTIRDHGGLIFIDLRNEKELIQCVFSPEQKDIFEQAEHISRESVLKLKGTIKDRSPETINEHLPTGKIELVVDQLEVVAVADVLPFDPHMEEGKLAGEETRLKYRYLDFRRGRLNEMMWKKHKLVLAVRNWFDEQGYLEVQTPILANSSPEGARDFLVPSRIHPGKFYALPQAPQQFKQLLMVGGFNKYFQIAPCFRDEDPRSDRHPGDFYQIDGEVAWANSEQIKQISQKLVVDVLSKFTDKELMSEEFITLTHQEAMESYGSDKPDLRYGLKWESAKDVFAGSGFKVFADMAADPTSLVQSLVIKGAVGEFSRSDLDRIQNIGREAGLPGIAYIQYLPEETKSPILKFLDEDTITKMESHLGCEKGDLVLFIAHKDRSLVYKAQDRIRKHLGAKLDLIDDTKLQFVWIEKFPFFEVDEETGDIDFGHNPFGQWYGGVEELQRAIKEDDLESIEAVQYDIACNGYEVLSGGERNANPEALKAAFQAVGYTEEEVEKQFGHMLKAYTYGAPPHAGFAWGLDRLFMILEDEDNIREVIAFPKNGSAQDAMLASPAEVSNQQLKELNLKATE